MGSYHSFYKTVALITLAQFVDLASLLAKSIAISRAIQLDLVNKMSWLSPNKVDHILKFLPSWARNFSFLVAPFFVKWSIFCLVFGDSPKCGISARSTLAALFPGVESCIIFPIPAFNQILKTCTSKSSEIMYLLRILNLTACHHNFVFLASHILGRVNYVADALHCLQKIPPLHPGCQLNSSTYSPGPALSVGTSGLITH